MTDNLRVTVDNIGIMKARIAPLLAQLKELEDHLKSFGPGRYVGARFESNVYEQERSSLDMAAVREHLSRQFIAAHTTVTEVTCIKTTARLLGEESLDATTQQRAA
jgi:hypothetical protein